MAHRYALAIRAALFAAAAGFAAAAAAQSSETLDARLDALEAQVTAAEDVSAIKRLQRTYGYYLDKGMWEDLAEFYTDDAVANYPAGVYIGHESIRKHLFMNVGGATDGRHRAARRPALQPHEHPARGSFGSGWADCERPLAGVRVVRQFRRRRDLGRRRL